MPWAHYIASRDGDRYCADTSTAFHSSSAIALFSGPWSNIAASAFNATLVNRPRDCDSLEAAYQNAIKATQAEWDRIEASCTDPGDMFGQGAADGGFVFLDANVAKCFWVGATPILHIRDAKIHSQNVPHTLYHMMIAQGAQPTTDQFHTVKYKSFVHETQIASSEWSVLPKDRIIILPYRVRPSLLPTIAGIRTSFPKSDADEITRLVAPDCQPYAAIVILSECIP